MKRENKWVIIGNVKRRNLIKGKKMKKTYRSRKDKVLLGVCGGLGDYFDIDPVLIRIIFILLSFVNGFGILLYLVSAIERVITNNKRKSTISI